MARRICVVLAIVVAALLQCSAAQTTHVVGDDLGWQVPPGGSIAYATWASLQTFKVGDTLVFNFKNDTQDVAKVTKAAYEACNGTNPISLISTSPASFILDTEGEHYFIGTLDRRCALGQKLAINVTASSPVPAPTPSAPRTPVTYVVGDKLGWLVPPGGPIAYATWAYNKNFMVGDTLVFNFENGTQDVAKVTKAAFDDCNSTNPLANYTTAGPTISVLLDSEGEHYYICTFPRHCPLGQKLAINVTAGGSTAIAPSPGPSAGEPTPLPVSSAPSVAVAGFSVSFLFGAIAFLF
ncbi:hypothetical protein HHK36_006046 [Tetracentron sinense]|uniref:Phytocyanin domain-containing protein n=1 Tax=Tetracentron sinense TaxID=13715 RepID=A0A834ZGI3_TETSI|nr:hypothetical protein HHK36_006046 [Tetracentron sinense]